MIRLITITILLLEVATVRIASAQPQLCTELLSGGVFERRTGASINYSYERLRYVFCHQQASTEESARNIAASLNIPISALENINVGGSSFKSNYKSWRDSLCKDFDMTTVQYAASSAEVITASDAILNAFNRCVTSQDGLFQFAEAGGDSREFIWHIIYKPNNVRINSVDVDIDFPSDVSCTYNRQPVPAKLAVASNGIYLRCRRNTACKDHVVIINSTHKPLNPQIRISAPALPPPPTPPAPYIVGPVQQSMDAPFVIPLPGGHQCRMLANTGHWQPHCPNPHAKLSCVNLTITDGAASSGDYDRDHYADNCGTCSYTFECTAPMPKDPFEHHPCRKNGTSSRNQSPGKKPK